MSKDGAMSCRCSNGGDLRGGGSCRGGSAVADMATGNGAQACKRPRHEGTSLHHARCHRHCRQEITLSSQDFFPVEQTVTSPTYLTRQCDKTPSINRISLSSTTKRIGQTREGKLKTSTFFQRTTFSLSSLFQQSVTTLKR